jgi:hypothetical protein
MRIGKAPRASPATSIPLMAVKEYRSDHESTEDSYGSVGGGAVRSTEGYALGCDVTHRSQADSPVFSETMRGTNGECVTDREWCWLKTD